ncbi:hypothetical protein L914_02500, partial [Phytophthora nicotianae]
MIGQSQNNIVEERQSAYVKDIVDCVQEWSQWFLLRTNRRVEEGPIPPI